MRQSHQVLIGKPFYNTKHIDIFQIFDFKCKINADVWFLTWNNQLKLKN